MNKEMVSFLNQKPVVDYSYSSTLEIVFKLLKGYTEVGKVNKNGETKKYNEYNVIIKNIKEAKAFSEYKIIKKQGNKLLGYD